MAQPPRYKYLYFDLRAKGEIVRLVLEAAGIAYDDIRVDYFDEWAKIKSKTPTPFGQLPVMTIGGVDYSQSYSISRYLARMHGLAGKSEADHLRADMIVDCLEDTIKPLLQAWFYTPVEPLKSDLKTKFTEQQLPVFLTDLQTLLTDNNGGNGYFVGDGLTWADLEFLILGDWLEYSGLIDQLSGYPKLLALRERVQKLPRIAAWLAKRPINKF